MVSPGREGLQDAIPDSCPLWDPKGRARDPLGAGPRSLGPERRPAPGMAAPGGGVPAGGAGCGAQRGRPSPWDPPLIGFLAEGSPPLRSTPRKPERERRPRPWEPSPRGAGALRGGVGVAVGSGAGGGGVGREGGVRWVLRRPHKVVVPCSSRKLAPGPGSSNRPISPPPRPTPPTAPGRASARALGHLRYREVYWAEPRRRRDLARGGIYCSPGAAPASLARCLALACGCGRAAGFRAPRSLDGRSAEGAAPELRGLAVRRLLRLSPPRPVRACRTEPVAALCQAPEAPSVGRRDGQAAPQPQRRRPCGPVGTRARRTRPCQSALTRRARGTRVRIRVRVRVRGVAPPAPRSGARGLRRRGRAPLRGGPAAGARAHGRAASVCRRSPPGAGP